MPFEKPTDPPDEESTRFLHGDETQDGPQPAEDGLSALTAGIPEKALAGWPFPDWERYQFLDFLGQGAMGQVFSVFDPELHRAVAMKVLNENATIYAIRFLDEARAQARIDHPHVAKVHAVGEVEGRPYLTMQLLQGKSLLNLRDQLSLEECVEVIRQACEGVEAAHSEGLLHRDLKPANIVVERNRDGDLHAYVVDFGMVLDTALGNEIKQGIMGTPAYMSPEQAAGSSLDPRSDVFSLGTTLYAVLTGQSPFAGESLDSTLERVASIRPDSPQKLNDSIPTDLAAVVMKAMEKTPDLRYPTAMALAMDLQRWLNGDPVEAMHQQPLYLMRRWLKKNRAVAVGILLLGLTVSGSAVWIQRTHRRYELQVYYYKYFCQESEKIETMIGLIEAMPFHNTDRERQFIWARIDKLKQVIAQTGDLAEAPGEYALGRSYMALEQTLLALPHLERAWALGLKIPEVALALGCCLSKLYKAQLLGLQGQTFAERKKELDLALKPRITQYLGHARHCSQPEDVAIAEAILASAEGRLEECLAKLDQVLASQPWRYPLLNQKILAYIEHGYAHTQPITLEPAWAILKQVQPIARSCANTWYMEIELSKYEMQKAIRTKQTFLQPFHRALQKVDQVKQLTSLGATPFLLESQLWLESRDANTDWFWTQPQDKEKLPEVMRHVIKCVNQAKALNADSSNALSIEGQALVRLGEWELWHNHDPRPYLDGAIRTFQELFKITQKTEMLGNLGNCFSVKGQYEMTQGQDPWASLNQGITCYKQVEALHPNSEVYFNLGQIHLTVAQYQFWQARNAKPYFEAALQAAQQAVHLQSNPMDDVTLAEVFLQWAEYSLWHRQPNREALRRGSQHSQKALTHLPGNPEALTTWVKGFLLESASGLGRPNLDKAKGAMEKLLAGSPKDINFRHLDAWLDLENFRQKPSWQGYQALERKTQAISKETNALPTTHMLAAEACFWALNKQTPGATATQWKTRMQHQVQQAKRKNPLFGPEADRWLQAALQQSLP